MVRAAIVVTSVLVIATPGYAKIKCPKETRAKTEKLEVKGAKRQFCLHKASGKLHGPWVHVAPGVREEVTYVDGVRHGVYSKKDRDFTLEGTFNNGLRDKEWRTTLTNGGRLVALSRYRNGRLTGLQESWDRTGKRCRSSRVGDGSATLQQHATGTCWLSAVVLIENGVFHGPAKHLEPTSSKKLTAKGRYYGGQKHGVWKHWDVLSRSSITHRCYVAGVELWQAKKLDSSRTCKGDPGPLPKDVVSIGLLFSRAGATTPLLVSGVVQGGPAARAGIEVGDAVERIGAEDAGTMDPQQAAEALKQAGSPVKLLVRRERKRRTVELRPALLSGMLVRNAWLAAHRAKHAAGGK